MILVINQPFLPFFCRTQRWAAKTRARVLRPPDWLAYTTAVLENEGFEVEFYDLVAENKDKDFLKKLVREKKPDFVVLDSTTPSIYSDIECAKIVKENLNAKVIMVGPHISALPEETLKLAQGSVDVACIGEYDLTVRDVIKNFNNLENVEGIAYYADGKILKTPQRKFIEDLDSLPFPAWHHLNLWKYFDGVKLYPFMDIISGRGCPHRCIFCLWPQVMHGIKYRLRSPKNVVDEIEYDIKLFPSILKGEFFFEDDTFTVDRERAILICEEILKRNLKITFSINGRVDNADLEMFKIMKRAGCREILVGFESGVQEILNNVNKKITLDQSRRFMELAKKVGFTIHGCFVIGLPGETEETAKETMEFALSLKCDTIQVSGAVPFPGTIFFKMCKEKGWLRANRWDEWLLEGEQKNLVEYPEISAERINYYVDLILKKFYFRPQCILKLLFTTRNLGDFYRKLRGAKNFISYLFKKI